MPQATDPPIEMTNTALPVDSFFPAYADMDTDIMYDNDIHYVTLSYIVYIL